MLVMSVSPLQLDPEPWWTWKPQRRRYPPQSTGRGRAQDRMAWFSWVSWLENKMLNDLVKYHENHLEFQKSKTCKRTNWNQMHEIYSLNKSSSFSNSRQGLQRVDGSELLVGSTCSSRPSANHNFFPTKCPFFGHFRSKFHKKYVENCRKTYQKFSKASETTLLAYTDKEKERPREFCTLNQPLFVYK